MFTGIITMITGGLSWFITHWKLSGLLLLCVGSLLLGLYLAGVWQDAKDAKEMRDFEDWYKDANDIAGKYEETRRENDNLRRKLMGRIHNAKDSSFGCHVDADGMSILAASISRDTSKPHNGM